MSAIHPFSGLKRTGLLALAIGAAGMALGLFLARDHFFKSYLLGYVLFLSLSLGALVLTMLHHVTGGAWGFVLRRIQEASLGNIPLMALLALPIIAGMSDLYPWARPEVVAADEVLKEKAPYLNPAFFTIRLGLYFAIWTGMAFLLRRWSVEQEKSGDSEAIKNKLRSLSGPGIVVFGLTVTFASIDLLMSLDPKWFSTVYALLVMVIQALMALAFGTAMGALVPSTGELRTREAKSHFHDLGNLMLAFVMLWAYMMLCQYLIIWAGNLPEEITWYLVRSKGGWQSVSVLLVVIHFILPFLLLLFRATKRNPQSIGILACGLLVAVLVDFVWLIAPSFYPDGVSIHWLDLAAILGIGGIWLLSFVWLLSRRALIPANDPDLPPSFVAAAQGGAR